MIELISWVHPGLVICLGGLLIPFIPWRRAKQAYFLLLPMAGLAILVATTTGVFGAVPPWPAALHKGNVPFLQYTLDIVRINKLSMLFGYVYVIAAFCMNIYALGVKNDWEHVAAMIYAGSALGAVFAGDLFTLFFCLEIMSWAPFFLILFRGTRKAMRAAIRYILWHHFSGLCILAGILIHVHQSGSIEFAHMPWGWGGKYLGSNLMLLGFIINSATTPFHSWLSDSYSEATPSGSIYMTAFTTKTAIFCLITTFSGVPLLMWMGAIQAVFALFLAVLENDGRRLCSYHIISQIGYMVAGVGMGTEMGLNGAASHALCHIIYNALLYMGAGCALVVVGTAKFNELGGLYKYMPIAFWLYMIGGFSISGFPLFNGFVSKTMTIEAAEFIQRPIIYLLLEGATVGTFLHTGLKLPWNIWLQGREEPPPEIRTKLKDSAINTPVHMLIGMGILAFLCVFLGVYPKILYDMLPYPVEFVPFTATRVFSITQMFIFSFLGFWFLRKLVKGYPTYTLDTDWFARIPGKLFIHFCQGPLVSLGEFLDKQIMKITGTFIVIIRNPNIEVRLTPKAIGFGVLMSLVLFSIFLFLKI
ncbi:NADH-ubiquinone oxidoreductase chain L (EC [Olavius sp. associated proteobacterium Delta 1]|nr:NADH-ubiquinone oxidoreductase chain L (EC [Olavius sp. associated proteobacterium Delta 1]